jgi:hypothetical protein
MSTTNASVSTRSGDQRSHLRRFYGEVETPSDRAPRAWPKYMTARVAADYCDTSPWTIRRHVQPCGRRGRTFVYSIDAVEQWMRGASVAVSREHAPAQRGKPPSTTSTNRGRDRNVTHPVGAAVADRRRRVTP